MVSHMNRISSLLPPALDSSMSARSIYRITLRRIGVQLLAVLLFMLCAVIALAGNHHTSVGFGCGIFVGALIFFFYIRSSRRFYVKREIEFAEALPPFAVVLPLSKIIEMLTSSRDDELRELASLLSASIAGGEPTEVFHAIQQASMICARLRARRRDELQPLLAAVHYHLLALSAPLQQEGSHTEHRSDAELVH